MSKIFGGSKSKSTSTQTSSSSNRAFEPLNNAFTPAASASFNAGSSALNSELAGGFEGYKANTGFDFLEKLGLQRVSGDFAGRGALQSGAAMKGMAEYQNGLQNQSYNAYLDKLLQQAQLGIGGGQLVSGAGGTSTSSGSSRSSGSSSPGIMPLLGSAISSVAASDPRLKNSVVEIGKLPNGLGVYEFQYNWDDDGTVHTGVMADEVREIQPEALGPNILGYDTVDYSKIKVGQL